MSNIEPVVNRPLFSAFLAVSLLSLAHGSRADDRSEEAAVTSDRASLLLAADDSDLPLDERLKANRKARDEAVVERDRPAVLETFLVEARLRGVAGQARARARALKKARRVARRMGETRTAIHIRRALKGDASLEELVRKLDRAEQKSRARPPRRAKRHLIRTKRALKSWAALEDGPRRAEAVVALMRYQTLASHDAARTLRRTTKLLRVGGVSPDSARARAQVRRLRSRLLARLGRWEDAAHESLVADRVLQPGEGQHQRSRQTAQFCREAAEHRVDCALMEEEHFEGRTFYDFSVERTRRFRVSRAAAVKAEYEGAIENCLLTTDELDEMDRKVRLMWEVQSDGRVKSWSGYPRFVSSGSLGACLDSAFDLMRYPRFRGPSPALELSYDLDLHG